MNNFFSIIVKCSKLFEALKNEKLTKTEILSKGIPGINKNTIIDLLNTAVNDSVLILDGDRYALDTDFLACSFTETTGVVPHKLSGVEKAGLPPLPSEEEVKIENLEHDIKELEEMNYFYGVL